MTDTTSSLIGKFAEYLRKFDGSENLCPSYFRSDAEELFKIATEHFAMRDSYTRKDREGFVNSGHLFLASSTNTKVPASHPQDKCNGLSASANSSEISDNEKVASLLRGLIINLQRLQDTQDDELPIVRAMIDDYSQNIVNALNKPVIVSLEKCAIAASQWYLGRDLGKPQWDEIGPRGKQGYREQVKLVLDAAGVKYE